MSTIRLESPGYTCTVTRPFVPAWQDTLLFLIAAAYPFRLRYADTACGVVRQSSMSTFYYVPLAGIEPATFRSGGERTIHCATGANLLRTLIAAIIVRANIHRTYRVRLVTRS